MPLSIAKIAGSGSNDAEVGTVAWLSPGNITADDGSYSQCNMGLNETSQLLVGTNFGFLLPPSRITGVMLTIQVKANTNSDIFDTTVKLYNNSTVLGNDKSTSSYFLTSDVVRNYGGNGDLWGLSSLSFQTINSSGFGAAVSVFCDGSTIGFIDYFQLTVWYDIVSGYSVV